MNVLSLFLATSLFLQPATEQKHACDITNPNPCEEALLDYLEKSLKDQMLCEVERDKAMRKYDLVTQLHADTETESSTPLWKDIALYTLPVLALAAGVFVGTRL